MSSASRRCTLKQSLNQHIYSLREKEKMYLKVIEENAKTIADSEKALTEKDKLIAELMKKINNQK